jgi:hypothetical protein
VFTPAWEKDNRISNFFPNLFNGTDFNTGLVTSDEAVAMGLSRSTINTYKQGWQPRIGIAWDVWGEGKTAVRAVFGRYTSRSNVIEDLLRLTSNPPWTTTVSAGSGWNGLFTTLANCPTCRSLDTINPGLATNVAGVNPNAGFNAVDPNFRPPESYQWNLTISHQLLQDTTLEASYIGNHGLHIWRRNVNRNDIAPDIACRGAACDGSNRPARLQISRAALGVTNNPVSPFTGSGGETWNWLQNLKEEVSRDLLSEGPLCQNEILGLRRGEESKANAFDIEWLHRAQLETRLREIIDAQDRLLDGTYGKCAECGEQIAAARLIADPATCLCLQCQKLVESDRQFCTL